MPKPCPDRDRRRRAFLRALGAGSSVVAAAAGASIPWSTLYVWRRDAAKFRAAWDRAAKLGRAALADRFQAALIERAIEGIDEPVFHAGAQVGTRKRYSDPLLLAALHDLETAPQAATAAAPPHQTVIIQRFGPPPSESAPAKVLATATPGPAARAAPEPAPTPTPPVSRWGDNLTGPEAEERW